MLFFPAALVNLAIDDWKVSTATREPPLTPAHDHEPASF